jgi:hypothetical protein
VNWLLVVAVALSLSAAIALLLTARLPDAPAWWQAILSGVGIFLAVLVPYWQSALQEKRQAKRERVRARTFAGPLLLTIKQTEFRLAAWYEGNKPGWAQTPELTQLSMWIPPVLEKSEATFHELGAAAWHLQALLMHLRFANFSAGTGGGLIDNQGVAREVDGPTWNSICSAMVSAYDSAQSAMLELEQLFPGQGSDTSA